MTLKELSDIFRITERIDTFLFKSRVFRIVEREFILKSIEGLVEYSTYVIPISSLKNAEYIRFDRLPIKKIIIKSSPGFSEDRLSVLQSENTLILNPVTMDVNATEFLFTFIMERDIFRIIRKLVKNNAQIESSDDEGTKYWLHSQMTNIQEFQPVIRKFDLTEIPFIVNVGIHQDVKTKFPRRRIVELELISEWVRERDREKKRLLSHRHIQHKSQRPREKEIAQVLDDLQDLFLPHVFKDFIKVEKDFNYSDCFRGTEFYSQIPFRTFPKWMTVLSRTDLSIEKPASNGELIYDRPTFQEEVEKAITKK